VERNKQQAILSWVFVAVLVSLCATLGVIQYTWIGEVSRAEHERLRGNLQLSLQRFSQDFNSEINAACSALIPDISRMDETEREKAYAIRYLRWRGSSAHNGLFSRVTRAIPQGDTLILRNLDLDKGTFEPAEWPAAWNGIKDRLAARLSDDPSRRRAAFGKSNPDELAVIDLPQFGHREGDPFGWPREVEWLLVELDLDYVRASLLPELMQRHLGGGEKPDYHVEIVAKQDPGTLIFDSEGGHANRVGIHSDASVTLFDVQYDQIVHRGDQGPGEGHRGPPPPGNSDHGRWLLSVRHRSGSLEAAVDQARRRNLSVTAGILLLMLAAIAALVQFTRRAQKLAQLQMEFVAGVSHELRTPLSVIRTAAHNLGGRVISNANQVQRYGALIAEQTEKLTGIVEQVLLFSNARAGRVIRTREVVSVDYVIEDALAACARVLEESRCSVEKRVEAGIPPILGDATALQRVLLNLISNAAKYGGESGWIGVFAAAEPKDAMIEIRVADHGPGIPSDELGHIFDPFYRGKRAVEDQIHGTGLGLSLVKQIIEAHGGTVTAHSELGKGTEFVVRIPAAPADQIDEFADSVNRR